MLRYSFGESKKDKRLENELKKLKDRQRRQSGDLEDLLNDRLDEFKDEISAQQKGTISMLKKRISKGSSAKLPLKRHLKQLPMRLIPAVP